MAYNPTPDSDLFFGCNPGNKTTGAHGSSAPRGDAVTSGFESAPATQDSFKAPGSSGGQGQSDQVTVTHNVLAEDKYVPDTDNSGTSPSYKPVAGSYSTDTGAGKGNPIHDFFKKGRN